MALTCDSNIKAPKPYAKAGQEVLDDNGDASGMRQVARAQNTLYEQLRGSCVNDNRGTGSSPELIIGETGDGSAMSGDIARYRPKRMGGAGLTDEDVHIYLWIATNDNGDSKPSNAQIDVTENVSGNSVSWNYTGDESLKRIDLGQLTVTDAFASEFLDFEVEITSNGMNNRVTVGVYGVEIYYERDKSVLTAVGLGSLAYDNGFTPHDLARFDGEEPMSTYKMHTLHKNAEYLYQHRVGNVITTSNPRSPLTASNGTLFATVPPEGVTELRLWFHVTNAGSGVFAGSDIITIQSYTDTTNFDPSITGWRSTSVSVTPEQSEVIIISGETPVFDAISAYWIDGELS